MTQFKLASGTVIHIQGIPFFLVHDTTFEGHQANVEMVTQPDPDMPNFSLWLENARRPWWKRLLGIR
jgi:hypothetical protein